MKNDENWFTLSEIIVKIKWSTFLRHGIDSVETESKISVQIETYVLSNTRLLRNNVFFFKLNKASFFILRSLRLILRLCHFGINLLKEYVAYRPTSCTTVQFFQSPTQRRPSQCKYQRRLVKLQPTMTVSLVPRSTHPLSGGVGVAQPITTRHTPWSKKVSHFLQCL